MRVRSLTFSERLLMANPPGTPIYIQVVVPGDRLPDPDAVTEALVRAAEACPGTRLRTDGRHWLDTGRPPAVRVLDGDGWDRSSFTGLPELARWIDGAEPLCEVVLLTGSQPAFVFRAHHALMGAQGVLLWAKEVFRALRGETPQEASHLVDELAVITETRPRKGNAPKRPTTDVPLLAPSSLATEPGMFTYRRTVAGYHAGVVAKLAAMLTRLSDVEETSYEVSSDLRRLIPDVRTTSSLSTGLTLPVRAGEDWSAVYERMLRSLAEDADLAALPPLPVLRAMARVPLSVIRNLFDRKDRRGPVVRAYGAFLLSHVGRHGIEEFSGGGFTASTVYSLPIRGVLIVPGITVTEAAGRTEIIISGDDVPAIVERGREFLDRIVEGLSAANSVLRGPATPPEDTVLTRFAEQCRRSADHVAVRWPGGQATYAELDARSDAVGAGLVRAGVGPGQVVGLFTERGLDAVAGILGVLKVGAAYLPLDPDQPDARLRTFLADADAAAVLTQRVLAGRVVAAPGCPTVVIDELAVPTERAVHPAVRPEELAYVIYTSGSTGTPKGVEVTHAGLANYTGWAIRHYELDATSCFPVFTSLGYDLCVTSLLPPLLAGGQVVMVAERTSHVVLAKMFEEWGVNSVKLTPSHLDLLQATNIRPSGVRLVVVGGEQLTSATAAAARELFGPQCRIVNEYGPTEATVGCVVHTYDVARDVDSAVPIGVPVDNMSVLVLDDARQPVPVGEIGELFLAGPQLARGYRGGVAADSFPTLADGTRAYRTADLVRLLPSGELQYLGRADDQVKISGHRVEPAEVEHVLTNHDSVRQAVVLAHRGVLVAYVALKESVSSDELIEFVSARLPEHMVPAGVTILPDIPLGPSGKVDRAALPTPDLGPERPESGLEPDNETARVVREVWARVLGLDADALQPSSDFHRLGGTSVMLLTVIAEISRAVLGQEREDAFVRQLGAIVRDPTLRGMTEVVSRLTRC
ncbi:MAG TPA: non-ribosomal peptide synthetase [Pseudonocardiaceae bacterium]|nr:non-ribosomal peptide synthetase [Pseudonocardiaceae bacterium]